MIRFVLVVVVSWVSFAAFGGASAQNLRLPDEARRAITAPQILTPASRESLAARLARVQLDAVEIEDTATVSVLSPVVGDPGAPTLALSAQLADWNTFGADARVTLRAVSGSRIRLRMQLAGGHRYLVVCNMSGRGEIRMNNAAWPGWTLTWEGREQAAVLLPALDGDAMQYIDFDGAGWIRSCEVSRLG